ncbi:MAG: MmgE/PrpD family protein [Caulobacteraceae bacterium]
MAAGGLAGLAAAPAGAQAPSAPKEKPPTTVTAQYVAFAHKLTYAALSEKVVHEAKRYVLDSLGCTVAGWRTDKGRIAAETMASLGGAPQARVIGSKTRTSVTNAAFANAELMNGLDYDAIPHIPPVTLPALLAVAEHRKLSGKALITGIVAAYEIAARLSGASSQMISALVETGSTPHVFGINDEAIMASAAGLSNMLGLNEAQTAYAIGVAGYYCPPQASHDWETGAPKSMVKYVPVGWICQGAVTAALLAEAGFTSNPIVMDGPAGFPDFYGWPAWKPEAATRGLGTDWRITTIDFKPYACCRFVHSRLDCLYEVLEKNRLKPGDIAKIHSLGVPFTANPDQYDIRTQPDAQFSIPYMLAMAALGVPIDAYGQDATRLKDPALHAMMKKITFGLHPDAQRSKTADMRSYIARAEVTTTDGRTLTADRLYASGTAFNGGALTDDHLRRKFGENARTKLSAAKAKAAEDLIWRLEDVADVGRVVDALTL